MKNDENLKCNYLNEIMMANFNIHRILLLRLSYKELIFTVAFKSLYMSIIYPKYRVFMFS